MSSDRAYSRASANSAVVNGNKKYDHFAFAGQSNADGHFFTFDYDDTPGKLGKEVFEDKIEELTGTRPGLVNVASSGAGSSEISNPTNYWWNMGQNKPSQVLLNAVANIKASLAEGEDLDGIVWAQGETDALAINATKGLTEFFTSKLLEATEKVFQYFWSELGEDIPIFIQELGEYPGRRGFDAVRDAQSVLVKKYANVHMGAETEGLGYLSDNIHFSTESKNVIAEDLADSTVLIIEGVETPPEELKARLGTTGDDYLPGTAKNDVLNGFEGVDVFGGSKGNDTIHGGDSGYNQVDYDGAVKDYKFFRNADGTITVTKPNGIDTLTDIDGIWFRGEGVWKALEDILDPTSAPPLGEVINGTADDDYLIGTGGNDTLNGLGGMDVFGGSKGNDIIIGGEFAYNQVDYDGSVADYKFVRNADGSVTVTKPSGIDTLTDINGFWFRGEGVWKGIAEVLEPTEYETLTPTITGTAGGDYLPGTDGDDVIDGLAGLDVIGGSKGNDIIRGGDFGYNQVDYDGASGDYSFARNADGTVTVTKPEGTDILVRIDGIWFRGENVWRSIDVLVDPAGPPPPGEAIKGTTGDDYLIGTDGNDVIETMTGLDVVRGSGGSDIIRGTADSYDQMDYDGRLADYKFTANTDGSVTVDKPGGFNADTLTDFDGVWFLTEEHYYTLEDILADATDSDDLI